MVAAEVEQLALSMGMTMMAPAEDSDHCRTHEHAQDAMDTAVDGVQGHLLADLLPERAAIEVPIVCLASPFDFCHLRTHRQSATFVPCASPAGAELLGGTRVP